MLNLTLFLFLNDTATTEIYTLFLHDALPISAGVIWDATKRRQISWYSLNWRASRCSLRSSGRRGTSVGRIRSEEHTSELQSPCNLACRLLLEIKKNSQSSRLPYGSF